MRLNDKGYYEDLFSMAETAEKLGLPYGRNKLYKLLVKLEVIDKEHMPNDYMTSNNYMVYRRKLVPKNGDAYSSVIPFFTRKGLKYISEFLKEKGEIS